MENAPYMRTFQYRSESRGLRKPQTTAHLFGVDPGLHNGPGPSGVGHAVCKSFFGSTEVFSVAASPRCSIEITYNQLILLTNYDGADCEGEDQFL